MKIKRVRFASQFIGHRLNFEGGARRRGCRSGATLIELVVAAVVLATIMTTVATLCVRVNLIWKDIGHRRVAIGELSNQLDRITRLSPDQAKQELVALVATDVCARTLTDPQLTGTLIDDDAGIRVVLQIDWKRRHPGSPLELVGWLRPRDQDRNQEASVFPDPSQFAVERPWKVFAPELVTQARPVQ